jgi:hypothetical protein
MDNDNGTTQKYEDEQGTDDSSWEFFISQEEGHSNLNARRSSNQDDKEKREKPWIIRIFREPNATDWFVFMLTAVIAGGTLLQWNAISGQLAEMKASGKQTDQLLWLYGEQIKELGKQVDQTHSLVKQAIISNENTVDTLHKTERPWVNAESLELEGIKLPEDLSRFSTYLSVKATIHLRNTGKSVAVNGWTLVNIVHGNRTEILNQEWRRSCESIETFKNATTKNRNTPGGARWPMGFVLVPGQGAPYEIAIGNQSAKAGETFWLIGCTIYNDQYSGPSHHTTFCFKPSNSGTAITFVPCHAFEEAN